MLTKPDHEMKLLKLFFLFASDITEDGNNATTDELVEKGENILKAKHGQGHFKFLITC